MGLDLLHRGRMDEAARLSTALRDARPGDAEVAFLASEVALASNDPETALLHISAAVAAAPSAIDLRMKMADNLIMLRRRLDAKSVAKEAAELAEKSARGLWQIGSVFSRCDDPMGALPYYEKARALMQDNPALLYDLAVARFHVGDAVGAEAELDKALALTPDAGHLLYLRSTLRRQTDSHNHIGELRTRLAGRFPNDASRAACLFALAKELEDVERYDESISALVEGATLKRGSFDYDAAAERAAIDGIRNAYTHDAMRTPSTGHPDPSPIFVVGMPRTGTTLVDRMLSRHDAVESAGELLDFGQVLGLATGKAMRIHTQIDPAHASLAIDFAALGKEYTRGARHAAPNSRMFIDKMPINFMYCGPIVKALPNAKIIHVVRDPMDSCYAIYKTLFGHAYLFSYDFSELAAYYACYARMMRHWHNVMPGRILDVRYEDLVRDTEKQARRIIDWCGLDWQSDVLAPAENTSPSTTASAAQVREPIHARSIQRWRKFGAALAPLRDRLRDEGVPVE